MLNSATLVASPSTIAWNKVKTFLSKPYNVILLLLGMVMEPGAILTLMLPVLLPIANGLGLNLVHFGVMVVLNLMIGQVTPPFGVCLFVISDVTKVRLENLYKSILPFLLPLIATLALVTYLPSIVTWLPNLLLG